MSHDHPELLPWKVTDSRELVKTPWFTLKREVCDLPNSTQIDDYYVVTAPEIVCMIALTAACELIVNAQYKHGIGQVVHEIPAGMIDEGEKPEQAARRELEEETGYIAAEWHLLSSVIASPSRENTRYHFYIALNATPDGRKKVEDTREEISNELIPWSQVFAAIADGTLNVLGSIAGVYLAKEWLDKRGIVYE